VVSKTPEQWWSAVSGGLALCVYEGYRNMLDVYAQSLQKRSVHLLNAFLFWPLDANASLTRSSARADVAVDDIPVEPSVLDVRKIGGGGHFALDHHKLRPIRLLTCGHRSVIITIVLEQERTGTYHHQHEKRGRGCVMTTLATIAVYY
jgi:hypothetical protein